MRTIAYANITDIVEDDLDCLSIEALFAELLIESEGHTANEEEA